MVDRAATSGCSASATSPSSTRSTTSSSTRPARRSSSAARPRNRPTRTRSSPRSCRASIARPEGDEEGGDYIVDLKDKAVSLTEDGITKIEKLLGIENLYDDDPRLTRYIEAALKAQVLFKRDRDYVVKDGEIVIVDEFTGRLMFGRRWSDGLHQAIEAKEGVQVQRESRSPTPRSPSRTTSACTTSWPA